MTGEVTLTSAMRANLYSLQQTASLMGTVQNRLSTGKKVNTALDNPNNYFSAQALTSRANDISSLLDGMGQAIQTIKAASQGITSAQSIVDQMKAVANSAIQSVSGSNAVATSSLNGTSNATLTTAGILTNATKATGAALGTPIAAGNTFTINNDVGGAGSALTTFTVSAGETFQNLADQIHSTFSNLTLAVNPSGQATITNTGATTVAFNDTAGKVTEDLFDPNAGAAGPANLVGPPPTPALPPLTSTPSVRRPPPPTCSRPAASTGWPPAPARRW